MSTAFDSIFGDALGQDPDQPEVPLSADLERILALPQRELEPNATLIAEPLSARLRTPNGTQTLRPLQALALVEAHDLGGLLALLPVGEGKTLITYLLPTILKAERPVLLIPAALTDKTDKDFAKLSEHWQQHPHYWVVSYELISRRPELLDELQPDLIVCDESNALKNPKAACTRRVHRYLRSAPDTTFCALSGTFEDRSFKDWWHIQQWALPPALHPLPYSYPTLNVWCQALDEKLVARRPPGELWRLAGRKDATLSDIRKGYGQRLARTPGVITAPGSSVKAAIWIDCKDMRVPVISEAVARMRHTWTTPDGIEFSEPADLWRHAREIANGFYYRWDPAPPDWWMEPRREFHAFVRGILGGSRTLDSMQQVVKAYVSQPAIAKWLEVKDKFTPNPVPVWLTTKVVRYAVGYARNYNALVWVEHQAVGHKLQELGLPYFGEGGMDAAGNSIQDHDGRPAAVSSRAVYRGFNLQAWNHNLVLNQYPLGSRYEQMIGRTHRFGQEADVVHVQMLFTVDEQRQGFTQAQRDCERAQETSGQKQKLCIADYL